MCCIFWNCLVNISCYSQLCLLCFHILFGRVLILCMPFLVNLSLLVLFCLTTSIICNICKIFDFYCLICSPVTSVLVIYINKNLPNKPTSLKNVLNHCQFCLPRDSSTTGQLFFWVLWNVVWFLCELSAVVL